MSSSPRIAFTGRPSSVVTDSGTPKKARKYRDGVSSSMSPPTPTSSQPAGVGGASFDLDRDHARVVGGIGRVERLQDVVEQPLRVVAVGGGGEVQQQVEAVLE